MDQHKLLLNDPPQEVIDGIWVGNHAHANKPNHGFDVVYSIGYEVDDETKYQLEPQKYKFFELGDTSSDDITPILAEIVELLRDDVAMNRKIYVHCQMGQSRSPSVIVAYLVVVKLMCLCKAISTMYERRPSAWINPVFRNQLEAFSRTFERSCIRCML